MAEIVQEFTTRSARIEVRGNDYFFVKDHDRGRFQLKIPQGRESSETESSQPGSQEQEYTETTCPNLFGKRVEVNFFVKKKLRGNQVSRQKTLE